MDTATLAEQWVKGLESGDLMALAPLISPTATVWHSNDGISLDLASSAARMAEAAAKAGGAPEPPPAFGDIRYQTTETGVLVQASVDSLNGSAYPVHIVQVLTVADGSVVRIEEYIAPQNDDLVAS